MSKRLTVF